MTHNIYISLLSSIRKCSYTQETCLLMTDDNIKPKSSDSKPLGAFEIACIDPVIAAALCHSTPKLKAPSDAHSLIPSSYILPAFQLFQCLTPVVYTQCSSSTCGTTLSSYDARGTCTGPRIRQDPQKTRPHPRYAPCPFSFGPRHA